MTRIQLVIVVAVAAIMAAIGVPKAIKMSRISRAERNIAAIADGFARYREDTGQECARIEHLLTNPNVSGWLGPYVNEKSLRNPWGGKYGVEPKSRKAGIPKNDAAPDQYEFGGSEEISFRFVEDVNL